MKVLKAMVLILILGSCVHPASQTQERVQTEGPGIITQSSSKKGVKTRAFILPIVDQTGLLPAEVVADLSNRFALQVGGSGDLLVVQSQDVGMKLDGMKISDKGGYQLNAVSEQVHKAGIPILIEPRLIQIEARGKTDPVGMIRRAQSELIIQVQLKAFNSRQNTELFDRKRTITIEESQLRMGSGATQQQFVVSNPDLIEKRILESFVSFMPELYTAVSSLAWEGRVALIQGDRVYLNVGRVTGIKVGDLLRVTDVGDEIYDPQTGQFIGRTPGRLKGTIEVVSYFGEDGSVAVLHSGSGFRENDRVELHW